MITNKTIRIILKFVLILIGLLAVYFCAKGMYNYVFICAVCSIFFGIIEIKFKNKQGLSL